MAKSNTRLEIEVKPRHVHNYVVPKFYESPLHFGNMCWTPELVNRVQLNRYKPLGMTYINARNRRRKVKRNS